MSDHAEQSSFDVVVIGAGAVGENVADRAVQGGLTAVLVEAELVGGECSYWACMPSKALLRPGTALHAAQSVPGAAAAVTKTLDAAAVLRSRDAFASHWQDDSQVEWVKSANIDFIRGHGWITGEREVHVSGTDGVEHQITANHAVVIATGSHPNIPDLEGIEDVPYWTTREATSSSEIPRRLIVLGGGVAGSELAQAYARLGSSVSLVARSGLLTSFAKPAADLVTAGLRADGVDVHLGTAAKKITENDDGTITVELDGTSLTADKVLVAMGRHPALEGVGLEHVAGLAAPQNDMWRLGTDTSGAVVLEESAASSTPWLYAVGDASGGPMLTHQGKYQARISGDAIVARAKGDFPTENKAWSKLAHTANDLAVPSVVFTDPELASVGLSEENAKKQGFTVSTVELPIAVAGSALHAENYKGWAQLVIDEDRKVILGARFAGPDVAELLHAATIAVVGEVPLDRLWHAVPAYPTVSEVWLRLLEKYGL
ncbi:dihydrolipoyl dehydrogenase family protein [Pseudarthrobacter sp. J1763]|uniref:dihydrolipoyl dehydrogenase family protein n=1 Tax=Pseudarthrobacter sp. J1763 TaxID=3420445 RepID=UPI003D274419